MTKLKAAVEGCAEWSTPLKIIVHLTLLTGRDGLLSVAMALNNISSTVHELTKAFAEVSPLILIVTAAILTAIASYKKVVVAWPKKMSSVEYPIRRIFYI